MEFAKVFGAEFEAQSRALIILWNLAKFVKIFLGIIARQQMGLLRERSSQSERR